MLLSGVVGSTAYGLAGPGSDVARLGRFAVPTISLLGLERPVESRVTTSPDVTLHEAGKAARLILVCNPTAAELLWLPDDLYETRTALGDDAIGLRGAFLSAKRTRDAYLGYATQQFRKLMAQADGRAPTRTAARTAKHARHLMRLVEQGFELYTKGFMRIRLDDPDRYQGFGERVAADPHVVGKRTASARAQVRHIRSYYLFLALAQRLRPTAVWPVRVGRKRLLARLCGRVVPAAVSALSDEGCRVARTSERQLAGIRGGCVEGWLEEVQGCLGPPDRKHPVGGWERVAAALGAQPPADFVRFADSYGACIIKHFLYVNHPQSRDLDTLEVFKVSSDLLRWLREAEDARERIPYPLMGEPGACCSGAIPMSVTTASCGVSMTALDGWWTSGTARASGTNLGSRSASGWCGRCAAS